MDGLNDDQKLEEQDKISHLLHDEIPTYEELVISYYLTSIYDHSIFEAFSKVVQKLVGELPTLEQLLNMLVQVTFFRFFFSNFSGICEGFSFLYKVRCTNI